MKKLLIFSGLLAITFCSKAQVSDSEKTIAIQLLQKNIQAAGLNLADLDNSIITGTYIIPGSNIRMVYLQQAYQNVPVNNQMQVLAFKNDQLVSNAGSRLSSPGELSRNATATPTVNIVNALRKAFSEFKLIPPSTINPLKTSDNGNKSEFGKMGVSIENITAELVWLPVSGTELKLVWQIFIAPKNDADYWLVRIDAKNNSIINKQSLTVKCSWDSDDHSMKDHIKNDHAQKDNAKNRIPLISNDDQEHFGDGSVVNSATYRVIKYPAESPAHPGGAPALAINPWGMSPGNATTLGWHYDGITYYNITRGNNVYAYEDRNADNIAGASGNSTTAQPSLTFDFAPDFSVDPTVMSPAPNQQFNITNLFYWNNLLHDLAYVYGFTESARNFQNNNQGLGGAGGDYVLAEAQDGAGTNNANFSTPPDGGRGRMQMFLWSSPTPDRDGDVDNGIIAHEYTHGISNRMTGSGSGCLLNAEQMGEGWSDYFGLMITHNWATALPGDGFSKPRGVGTYALNQANTGVGIRQYPYTSDMSINPLTYGNISSVAVPHGVGTIWCTALWDMTWEIIQQAGTINPNLFNPAGGGGNAIALKLVVEGMRLQPCSPGFIDGRNAILKADTLFFGAQYSCAIIKAFARRGMGIGASQGSSNSRTDQTLSFAECSASECNAPANLEESGITSGSATVSWDAVSGAVSYTVEYKLNSSSSWTPAASATTSTSVNISGLAAASVYDWRVKTNCSGSSSYNQDQFTTLATCNAPNGLHETAVTISSATVSWDAVSGAVNYTVEYKLNSSSSWITPALNTTSTSVNLTGLASSSVYDWRVRTNCSSGSSSYTQEQFITLSVTSNCVTAYESNETIATAPAVSTNTVISAAIGSRGDIDYYEVTVPANGNFNITLTNLPNNYDLYFYNSGGVKLDDSKKGGNSNEIISLLNQPAGIYYVKVIGKDANKFSSSCYSLNIGFVATCSSPYDNSNNGNASGASQIPFNTDITGLITPGSDNDYYKFGITTGGTATITLTTLPANYDIKLYASNGSTQLAVSQNGGTAGETISRTYTPGTYYIRVYGNGGANNANSCYTLKVTLGTASYEDENDLIPKVTTQNVFPNPANSSVTVRIGDVTTQADLLIYDIYGKLMMQQKTSSSNTTLNISSFASGIYIVRIKNNGKESNLKFIKQ